MESIVELAHRTTESIVQYEKINYIILFGLCLMCFAFNSGSNTKESKRESCFHTR